MLNPIILDVIMEEETQDGLALSTVLLYVIPIVIVGFIIVKIVRSRKKK